NIQAVLSWQIWDGGIRYGKLRDARAVESTAELQLEALGRTATVELRQAQRAIDVAEQARALAAGSRNIAVNQEQFARMGYREGRLTALDLLLAGSTLRDAEVTLALREFDLVQARIAALLVQAKCAW